MTKCQRRVSQPHIYQTMMYEPLMDTFAPSTTLTNMTYSNDPNIYIMNTSNNNHPHSHSSPLQQQLNNTYHTKRQINQLEMKHFNEQHKLNTMKSNNIIHIYRRKRTKCNHYKHIQ